MYISDEIKNITVTFTESVYVKEIKKKVPANTPISFKRLFSSGAFPSNKWRSEECGVMDMDDFESLGAVITPSEEEISINDLIFTRTDCILDGEYHTRDHDFTWYKVTNRKELDVFNFNFAYKSPYTVIRFPAFFAVDNMWKVIPLTDCNSAIKDFYKEFGVKVSFEEKTEINADAPASVCEIAGKEATTKDSMLIEGLDTAPMDGDTLNIDDSTFKWYKRRNQRELDIFNAYIGGMIKLKDEEFPAYYCIVNGLEDMPISLTDCENEITDFFKLFGKKVTIE